MLAAMLTGCNNDDNSESSGESSSSTTDTSPASDNSAPGESGAAPEDSSTPGESSTPEDGSDPVSDEPFTDDWSEPDGVDNSGLPYPDNRAGRLAKSALDTGGWPAMDLLSEQETVDVMISADLKLENCEEYCFATNIISAQLYKVLVVKPAAGSEDNVRTILDNYLEAVQNDPNISFYPGQQASAEGAVKGETEDGYLYVLVHENGADIESGMLAAQ